VTGAGAGWCARIGLGMISAQAPTLSPYAIFLRTRAAVSAARYPPALNYTIAVAGYAGDAYVTNHYRGYYSRDGGKIFVDPISGEEAAHPHTPHGVNFRITYEIGWNIGAGGQLGKGFIPAGRPEASADLVGVPDLSPAYMFGMPYVAFASPAPVAGPPGLRTIAVVGVGAPAYSVAFAGTATIGGSETYELALTPLRDPKDNRLRALWVGENDYLPRRAVVAGNFTVAPMVDVPWTIDFSVVNGAPLIVDEKANQPLFMSHHRVVRDVSIAFDDVREADAAALTQRPLFQQPVSDSTLIEP